jgi:hypothetical protein
MAITREEIESYTFDPQNPYNCKTYKLLLHILRKDNLSYLSPDFLRYFFRDRIINDRFLQQLWDIPENFGELTINEQLFLFKEQLSELDLSDYLSELNLDLQNISPVLKNFIDINRGGETNQIHSLNSDLLLKSDEEKRFLREEFRDNDEEASWGECNFLDDNKIIFSSKLFSIYNIEDIFQRASITITPLSQESENFFTTSTEYSENIKPLFLKRIEDVETLLRTVERELFTSSRDSEAKKPSNIDSISIKNYFHIDEIVMKDLSNKKEIYLVGESGDGKTLSLQAIILAMKQATNLSVIDYQKDNFLEIDVVDGEGNKFSFGDKRREQHQYIFAYGVSRYRLCFQRRDEIGYMTLFENCSDLREPTEWLKVLEYLHRTERSRIGISDIGTLFSKVFDKNIEVVLLDGDIVFKESGLVEEFAGLSTVFKGVITLLSDMVWRLSETQPEVESIAYFEGVILIDEVELHLDPDMQYRVVGRLREAFPKIQFFISTYSPFVLSSASEDSVIYKLNQENKIINISDTLFSGKNFKIEDLIKLPKEE